MNTQIWIGNSKYDIFDYKFWSLDAISPNYPTFATQMLLFHLKYTVAVVTHAHVLKIFYTTGVRGVACEKQHFRPKLEGSGPGEDTKIRDPYLFLQPLKLATSNLVATQLGFGISLPKKTTFRTEIGGGLGQVSIRKHLGPPIYFCNRLRNWYTTDITQQHIDI